MSPSFFLIREYGLRVFHTPRYRMHGSICHFPSKHFYGNRLENVENLKLLPASASVWPQPDQRVVWIDCDSPHQQGRVIQVGNSRCLLLHCFLFLEGGQVGSGGSRWWFGHSNVFWRHFQCGDWNDWDTFDAFIWHRLECFGITWENNQHQLVQKRCYEQSINRSTIFLRKLRVPAIALNPTKKHIKNKTHSPSIETAFFNLAFNGNDCAGARKLGDDRLGEQHISGEPRWGRRHCWSTLESITWNTSMGWSTMDVWYILMPVFIGKPWSSGISSAPDPFENSWMFRVPASSSHVLPPDFLWRPWVCSRSGTFSLITRPWFLEEPFISLSAWKVYKRLLTERSCNAGDVAIITPYKAQQQHIEKKLDRFQKHQNVHSRKLRWLAGNSPNS